MNYLIKINNHKGDSYSYIVAQNIEEVKSILDKTSDQHMLESVIPLSGTVYTAGTFVNLDK